MRIQTKKKTQAVKPGKAKGNRVGIDVKRQSKPSCQATSRAAKRPAAKVKPAQVADRARVKKVVLKDLQEKRTKAAPEVTPQAAFAALKAQCKPGSLVFSIYEHEQRVANYAMALFKDLAAMHRLDECWRTRLLWAAYLHDIAAQEGSKGHHKAAKKRILEDRTLPIPDDDRPFVALLARFHRKTVPTLKHRELMTLPLGVRKKMIATATLLRLADAFDLRHAGLVKSVRASFADGVVTVILCSEQGLKTEIARAKKKVKGLLDGKIVFAAQELRKKRVTHRSSKKTN